MRKLIILVEGITDVVFLSQYINELYSITFNKIEGNNDNNAKIFSVDNKIEIKSVGGYTNLLKFKTNIIEWTDAGYPIIVIFEADDEVETRRKYILEKLQEINKVTMKLFKNDLFQI